jgi:hypothetical protein
LSSNGKDMVDFHDLKLTHDLNAWLYGSGLLMMINDIVQRLIYGRIMSPLLTLNMKS